MKLSRQVIAIVVILLISISCKESVEISSEATHQNDLANQNERAGMSHAPILNKYDSMNIAEIPKMVEMSSEQKIYVEKILSSMRSVIDESSTLEVEENEVLGKGKFFWPKDPKKPTMLSKSYSSDNFQMQGIYLKISRESVEKPWTKAGISLTPRNFPTGVFKFEFPERFFDSYILINAEHQKRLNESVEDIIVFTFASAKNKNIFMVFEARTDGADVRDLYPRNFHLAWIERR